MFILQVALSAKRQRFQAPHQTLLKEEAQLLENTLFLLIKTSYIYPYQRTISVVIIFSFLSVT